MSDRLAIETVDLHKSYGSVEALRGLNLEVPHGTIFGFLGRNGAGKTTAIKILLGMTRPRLYRRLVQLGLVTEGSDDGQPESPEFIEHEAME